MNETNARLYRQAQISLKRLGVAVVGRVDKVTQELS